MDREAMAERDLYGVLGVSRTSSEKEIRKAYRELARKYHPDRNPGDKAAEERFKDASYASEVLLNPDKRRLYDEFGEIGLREGFNAEAARRYRQRASEGFGGGGGFGGFTSLQDLLNQMGGAGGRGANPFEGLFGGEEVETVFGRGRRGGRARGRDVLAEVTLEFVDAVRGSEQQISVQIPGEEPRTLKVRIPAGVEDGGKVRLRGQGVDGGDLVLQVRVKEHPCFRREGLDLSLDLPITVGEAYHGAKISVPTPEGAVSVRIPKGVKGGSKLRLRGKGVTQGGRTGDMLVKLVIVLPEGDVAEAVDQLEKSYSADVRKDIAL